MCITGDACVCVQEMHVYVYHRGCMCMCITGDACVCVSGDAWYTKEQFSSFFEEKYLDALSKMENFALSLRSQIEGCGFQLPVKGAWLESAAVDSLKFFLKQQQKAVEDGQGMVLV